MNIPDDLLHLLREAEYIAVLTGAGISAESGVPTFREAQTGLWERYDPKQLATPQAFLGNPRLVWEWYAWRRRLVSEVDPNSAHYALAEMAEIVPQFTLITQNVDGLHQRAGSKDVIELHGNIVRTKCFTCGKRFDDGDLAIDITGETLPRCRHCNGLLRPDVVWFGESLSTLALKKAYTAAHDCDLFFSIGTSALVQPAASLPAESLAQGHPTIEVNPQATPLTRYMTFVLNAAAGEVLPRLVQMAWYNE